MENSPRRPQSPTGGSGGGGGKDHGQEPASTAGLMVEVVRPRPSIQLVQPPTPEVVARAPIQVPEPAVPVPPPEPPATPAKPVLRALDPVVSRPDTVAPDKPGPPTPWPTNQWGLASMLVSRVPKRLSTWLIILLSLVGTAWAIAYMIGDIMKVAYLDEQTDRQERAVAALQKQSNEDKVLRSKTDARLVSLEAGHADVRRWACSRDRNAPGCISYSLHGPNPRLPLQPPDASAPPLTGGPIPRSPDQYVPEIRYVEGTTVSILPNP